MTSPTKEEDPTVADSFAATATVTVTTEATTDAMTVVPPSPIMYTTKTRPLNQELIEINENCFDRKRDGTERLPSASRQAKSRSVKKVVDSILNKFNTPEQQVLALREATKHPKIRGICKSAGIVDVEHNGICNFLVENIKRVIELAGKTNNKFGRPTDDLRSLVQSIVLASFQSPNPSQKKVSIEKQAQTFGLSLNKYKRILSNVKSKRLALEEGRKDTVYSRVVGRKGWTKVDSNLVEIVHKWIRRHPHVIESPIANDLVKVPDKTDPTKTVKTNKLLLQISIRELHNDLVREIPEATDPDGNVLISDTKLRQILPPELKRMTNRYKKTCGCVDCLSIQYYQSAYNRYKKILMNKLVNEREEKSLGSTERLRCTEAVALYENQVQHHPKAKDALQCIECTPPCPPDGVERDFSNLIHIDCAYGRCKNCPTYEQPLAEANLGSEDPLISFHTYSMVPTCSEHLALSVGSTECPICSQRRKGEAKGTFVKRRQLVLKKVPFSLFFKDFYLKALIKYKKHRFQYIILSKNHTGMDRKQIIEGEVWCQRDFAERLTLKFNDEAQFEHFAGGATISLEGVAVEFCNNNDGNKTMEFHTYLSDGRQQDSAVVNNHMEKLILFLMAEGVLKEGGRLLCHTDGCASQYRCGTAYYYLSSLAYRYRITIDRAISAPGHGKGIIDGK